MTWCPSSTTDGVHDLAAPRSTATAERRARLRFAYAQGPARPLLPPVRRRHRRDARRHVALTHYLPSTSFNSNGRHGSTLLQRFAQPSEALMRSGRPTGKSGRTHLDPRQDRAVPQGNLDATNTDRPRHVPRAGAARLQRVPPPPPRGPRRRGRQKSRFARVGAVLAGRRRGWQPLRRLAAGARGRKKQLDDCTN